MSFEDVLDKVSNGEPIVVCGKVYEPKQIYRFPHLHRFDGLPACDYIVKISAESREVWGAMKDTCMANCPEHKSLCAVGMTDETIIEIMDVMQACETALRNSGRTEDELLALMEQHNAKDAARGYDKPREDA